MRDKFLHIKRRAQIENIGLYQSSPNLLIAAWLGALLLRPKHR
jgi:hypothetical protein